MKEIIDPPFTAGDQAPIGIVLATDKDEILVEYASGSISNQIFVSRYKTHLPDRKALARELALLLEEQEGCLPMTRPV